MSLDDYLRSRSDRCDGCGWHIEVQGCRCPGSEWTLFVTALRRVVRADGTVHQCDVRPLIRDRIEPKHVGQLYRRARSEGLISDTGMVERSNDHRGRNSHRLEPVYALDRAA